MKNIDIKVNEEGIMTITLDTTKEYGRSKSGKTIVIASTEGNQNVNGVTVGINVYKYPKEGK